MSLAALRPPAETLAIAALGGAAFWAVGAPAPWLSGGTILVAIAAVAGRRMVVPDRLRDVVFILLGISMGGGVSPETLARVGEWPASIAILAVTVILIVVGVVAFFRLVCGWDALSAFFAAVPGALSYVMIAAADAGADVRRIAIAQSVRLVILIAVLPALVVAGTGHDIPAPTVATGAPFDLPVLIGAGLAGALVAHWLRVPGGLLFGAFVVSAGLHAGGWIVADLPIEATSAGFVVLAGVIGQRFVGITLRELAADALAGLGGFIVGGIIAAAGALAVARVTVIPIEPALVAFAPGALEGMTALAFGLGLDPAYVAAHQLLRFLAISLSIPFVARIYTSRVKKNGG
ncbi:MAG: AbrB family transcriptional regulator [Hyphomicrobiaceae bacterium]|nr:AbrB family transcriptional regulator [Hyphomicrobiaceae bacterium]